MKFSISSHRYSRDFIYPLKTARGVWAKREGFLIQLECEGRRACGEVAPIPEFGTESLSEATRFLQALGSEADTETISVPESLPCCAFAFSSALACLDTRAQGEVDRKFRLAGLLPSGADALRVLVEKQAAGFRCFKWKIGAEPFDREWALLLNMLVESAPEIRFRLDANASLSAGQTRAWLDAIRSTGYEDQIEFLEQPMSVGMESQMAELSESFGIPIALDESLNSLDGRRWLSSKAWAGPLVIKPCTLGSITVFKNELLGLAPRCVLSSSFETSVGLAQCLRLAADLYPSQASPSFSLGFDTQAAFNDSLGLNASTPELNLKQIEKVSNHTADHVFSIK